MLTDCDDRATFEGLTAGTAQHRGDRDWRAGVEVRALHSDDFGFLLDGTLTEFAIFDGQLSYEVRQPDTLDAGPPSVAVVADENRVARRQLGFEEIWEAAERV